jgi:hypothetical protein
MLTHDRSLECAALELWEFEMRELCANFCSAFPRELRDKVYGHILPATLINDKYTDDCTPMAWIHLSSAMRANFRRASQDAAFKQMRFELAQAFLRRTVFHFSSPHLSKLGGLLDQHLCGTEVDLCSEIKSIVLEVHCTPETTHLSVWCDLRPALRSALKALGKHSFSRCRLSIMLSKPRKSDLLCRRVLEKLALPLLHLARSGLLVEITCSFGSRTFDVNGACAGVTDVADRWKLFYTELMEWAGVGMSIRCEIFWLIIVGLGR